MMLFGCAMHNDFNKVVWLFHFQHGAVVSVAKPNLVSGVQIRRKREQSLRRSLLQPSWKPKKARKPKQKPRKPSQRCPLIAEHMAERNPPKLTPSDDKPASVRIWRRTLNAWCLLKWSWRDPKKDSDTPEYWLTDKAQWEIAAFYLALPDDILTFFDTTILVKLTETELSQPWLYQQRLEEHFVGQDDVTPDRLAFFNCTQKPSESITNFETQIRITAKKTRYAEMTNPLQELHA